ncbi:MAG: ATP-binding cassette domain-containing protein [Anaerolineae bacterium]|nr:ATP-binding cassette domain-containing protein [Anaerolineae bacterium]
MFWNRKLIVDPLLRVINLSKSFGTLPAVQQVSFEVYPGEIVGLAGRSGSGKTVLAMLLAGLYVPNKGDIYFNGQRLQWPFQARQLGIEVIHQRPDLAEHLDITGNIFLGNEMGWPAMSKWLKIPHRRRMDKEAARILAELDVHLTSLREKIANLSSEQRQMIAVARAMTHPSRLIIVDEPTDLLSYPYQQKLLSLIQTWPAQGKAIIFCSKNLDQLFAVSDRIIVLRQGQRVASHRTDETSREEVVAALIGAPDRQQLTPTIWALDSFYRAREQAEKLRHQQMLLQRNLAAQDNLNQQLIDQLAQQIRALDQANLALQDAQRRLLTEREEERKRLARELHDQLIQDLLGVNYHLEEIEADKDLQPKFAEELEDICSNIRLFVDDLRRICSNLRPPTIDNLGLGVALQSYTRDWSDRTGISLKLDLDANLGRLPEAIELSIFRIIQEGLSNVRKHARANAVEICLKHTSPRTLMISIADNGSGLAEGFDLSALSARGHYGLLGISERVALLGGRLKLQNQADGGLFLQVEIPHPRVEAAPEITIG